MQSALPKYIKQKTRIQERGKLGQYLFKSKEI